VRSLLGVLDQLVRLAQRDTGLVLDLHAVIDHVPKAVHVTEDHVPTEFARAVVVGDDAEAESDQEGHDEFVAEPKLLVRPGVGELGWNRHVIVTLHVVFWSPAIRRRVASCYHAPAARCHAATANRVPTERTGRTAGPAERTGCRPERLR